MPSLVELSMLVRAEIAALAAINAREVSVQRRFSEHGIDSGRALELLHRLEQRLGRSLPSNLLWECPTPESLILRLSGGAAADASRRAGSAGSVGSRPRRAFAEPIAVVGLAGRFPGANDSAEFWRLLREARCEVREVPADRWDAAAIYDPEPGARGKARTRWGGFLTDVAGFDAGFFRISPAEAVELDPQQRLALELAVELFEHSGLPIARVRGRNVGAFLGAMWSDYSRLRAGLASTTPHTATGQDTSLIAGRISYCLGLRGPSMTVNTACSSSLVAIHLACQSIRLGESELAIAGGVNLLLHPASTVAMSKFGGMAADGRCKAFAAAADGYVRGEGGGLVLLMPLSQALATGRTVHAVIEGSATNNDGFSNGLTAPSPEAQRAMLRSALDVAGVEPHAVAYVEAHGTGTPLGDPIEAQALGEVYGAGRTEERALRIGSVKTNIGHLEAAAGVTGLIKSVIAVREGWLPASLYCQPPNPKIPFSQLGLRVQSTLEAWPEDASPRRAGVSAFGFGGSNAHVLVREPPPITESELSRLRSDGPPARADDLALVCSGNGADLRSITAPVLRWPVFAEALERCDRAIARCAGWSVRGQLLAADAVTLARADFAQPIGFAIQVALAAMIRSWGVAAGSYVGHSYGEIAAAHLAGALDIDDAAAIVVERSRLQVNLTGAGGMLWVGAAPGRVEGLLEAAAQVVVAAINGPSSTVLSGPSAALAGVCARLRDQGIESRPVAVDIPYHGPLLDDLMAPLRARLAGLRPRLLASGWVSTVAAELDDRGAELEPSYWARNLREPVRFAAAIERLLDRGVRRFVELAPHSVLARDIEAIADARGVSVEVHASLRANEAPERSMRALHRALTRSLPRAKATPPVVVPISAQSPAALGAMASELARRLETAPSVLEIGASMALHRDQYDHRAAIVSADANEARAAFAALSTGREHPALIRPRGGRANQAPVFVFSGQGGQWPQMGRALPYEEPAFARALARCDRALRAWLPAPVEELAELEDLEQHGIAVLQPVLFAIQVALAELLVHWGVRPAAVVGHSMGEVAAAHLAGFLALEEAAHVIVERSRALSTIAGHGAMAVIELPASACADELQRLAMAGLVIAAENGPSTSVVSGAPDAVARLLDHCADLGVFARRVKVDVASHSPQVDALLVDFAARLRLGRRSRAPLVEGCQWWSTVHAGREQVGAANYWVRNLREPVRFISTIEALLGQGHDCFVELSPHPVALPGIEELVAARGLEPVTTIAVMRRDELVGARRALGELYAAHVEVDWQQVAALEGRPFVAPPSYPWQRRRYWPDSVDQHVESVEHAAADELVHTLHWVEADLTKVWARATRPRWLVVGAGEVADALAATLATRPVTRVGALDDVAGVDLAGVVLVESTSGAEPDGVEALMRGQAEAWSRRSEVARWAAARRLKLWLVTRGAQAVFGSDVIVPGGAPAWGFARALAAEQLGLIAGVVDLDDGPVDARAITKLAKIIGALDRAQPVELAQRGARWLEPRLRRVAPGSRRRWQAPGATFLVTGGLGELGLAVAGWLLDRGVRRVLLLGRTGVESGIRRAAVERLRSRAGARGAQLEVVVADVCDEAALRALFETEAISGVVHAAGRIEQHAALELAPAELVELARAKIGGVSALHRAAEACGRVLDTFVCFSSFAALLGSPTLAGYAAANAYLDAFMHYRRRLGHAGLSVNWGFWGEVGMAAQRGWAQSGAMRSFSVADGLAQLGRVLEGDVVQAAVVAVDWSAWRRAHGQLAELPILADLTADRAQEPSIAIPAVCAADLLDLPLADLSEREAGERVEDTVVKLVAEVLGGELSDVDVGRSLRDHGFDSLMLVALRNKIAEVGVRLSASALWTQPTVARLAQCVYGELRGKAAPSQARFSQVRELANAAPPVDDLLVALEREVGRQP